MPRIFDNIDQKLLDNLKYTAKKAFKADFCVGYFNLRGWQLIAEEIDQFSGKDHNCCRVLIGMQRLPSTQLYEELKISRDKKENIDNKSTLPLKKIVAQEFRKQLMFGIPTEKDEKGLQQLRQQLLNHKVIVKLHLKYPLHAKLYLLYKDDKDQPITGYLGSSNLTFSGLKTQGELNIDVLEHDATNKLKNWFDERWKNRFSLDISEELATIIDESWASESLLPPYYIYIKMAYHLSQEARDGLSLYTIPPEFNLFPFQEAAVRIAAHHVNRRGGVIIGDVVGLGKTLVGTAIARIIEEDFGFSTLIICPKNLVQMWENYSEQYGLKAKVLSIGKVEKSLTDIPARFRLVLIDESHNLRNRDGKRYAAIKDYIQESNSRCILLTATPYNKTYLDLSSQLRLFIKEDQNLGIKPEELIKNTDWRKKYAQISPYSLAAFEKSEYSEDWQSLMSKYMVRRTRSFIQDNYALWDENKEQKYLEFSNGKRFYFPKRIPKTATFSLNKQKEDPYAKLYSDSVVDIIGKLNIPRYALGSYELKKHLKKPTAKEKKILDGLSRAGRNLIGFCRTNLFKRLESSGDAFIESIERHILRNYIYLYAIESQLEIPIGSQDINFFVTTLNDQDLDSMRANSQDIETQNDDLDDEDLEKFDYIETQENIYQQKAQEIYQLYQSQYKNKFKWLRADLFKQDLGKQLREDAHNLMKILKDVPQWNIENDQKLLRLWQLITEEHPKEKILIFSQFADTVDYLGKKLTELGLTKFATVTGNSGNPSAFANRFSPKSNNQNIPPDEELRVLIATDVLSEGQNLQDCYIIVNYDLPWAIIRLIQRAGRVDRIGQFSEEILCYSFLPADGVETLINLRSRLVNRLQENAEVVGTDEIFFEDVDKNTTLDLYHEKTGILDDIEENEVDLVSEALSIWENAQEKYPHITTKIENLPNVVYSTREIDPPQPPLKRGENTIKVPLNKGENTIKVPLNKGENTIKVPLNKKDNYISKTEGVLLYMRTDEGIDTLAYVDKNGNSVTQSQSRILKLARCELETPAIARHPLHYDLVEKGANLIREQQKKMSASGTLGSPNSARHRTYKRLLSYIEKVKKETPLLASGMEWELLINVFEDIYKYPLKESAIVKLNRQLRSGITDKQLSEMVISLASNDALCVKHNDEEVKDSKIICSLGLFKNQ